MSTTTLKRTEARSTTIEAAFPKANTWHASAPESVRLAGNWGPGSSGWTAWQQHLAAREFATLTELLGARNPLTWGTAGLAVDQDNLDLIDLLARAATGSRSAGKAAAEQAVMWLRESAGGTLTESTLLECLAWAHALPALARTASADVWWELLGRLVALVVKPNSLRKPSSAWCGQLMQLELPFTLAWLLPELTACRELAADRTGAVRDSLAVAVKDASLFDPTNLPHLRARLASWLRSLTVSHQLFPVQTDEGVGHLGEILLHALRLTCPSGRQALDRRQTSDRSHELFFATLDRIGDSRVRAAARELMPASQAAPKRRAAIVLPPSAWHSEDAALGVLRRDWTPDGEMLIARYSDKVVTTELNCGRQRLWAGIWSVQLHLDGKLLEQRSDWDMVCWVSDEDVDYLELEARFTSGLRVQRQMLLARQDRLLYLADAVLGQTDGSLEYRGELPLDAGVQVYPAEETREMSLVTRRTCRVLPLALPEWRRDPRGGVLAMHESHLQLSQHRSGRRLYAPLVIDLDPRRSRQPLTWRQLTIAEDRQIVSADIAVGYRVQIGRQQWLVYRALGERANRTLLGSNLVSEFMFARFSAEGEADPLLEIE